MTMQGGSDKRWGWGGLLIAAGAGLLLGLLIAWVIAPVRWVNTDPADLRPVHRAAYVQMIADSYALNGNVPLAQERLLQLSAEGADLAPVLALTEQVAADRLSMGDSVGAARVRRLIDDTNLAAAGAMSQPGQSVAPGEPVARQALPNWVIFIFGAGILIIGLAAVAGLVLARSKRKTEAEPELPLFDGALMPLTEAATPPRVQSTSSAPSKRPSLGDLLGVDEPPAPRQPVGIDEALDEPVTAPTFAQPAVRSVAPTALELDDDDLVAPVSPRPNPVQPAVETRAGQVLIKFPVEYSYGDDDFYHSVTIDTPEESFVGQCGIVISDVLSSDDAQQVDAFDLWLFETNGTRTVSKVLLSPWAANNESIVARLSRKGETLTAREGLTITLQTLTLRLTAQVIALAFQRNEQRPEAIFEHLGLQLQVERLGT